jgi:hypothetical protein
MSSNPIEQYWQAYLGALPPDAPQTEALRDG